MNKFSYIRSGLVILFMALLFSCSKEEKNLTSLHYVSKEKKLTLTQTYINTFLQQFSNYPESSAIKNLVRNDVTIYKVKYRTKVKGEEISASALVCIPSVPGKYPVFSFQNGTNTRNSAAPTNDVLDPAFQMVEMISAMGYIVVIADYPGFGESSDIPHPYLVKEPTVQSLVDLLFTIKEMGGDLLDGVVPENRYYLLGYSQGGWATLALHKALETEYSGDFNLIGSVCGAGPYNIYEIFKTMTLEASYPQPVYLGYILNAYKWYEQFTNPLSDVVNPPYSERIPTLYNGEYTFGYINSQLSTSIPTLVNKDFIGGFISDPKYSQIRDALIRNSVQAWKTDKQLYLMHGGADDQVPPATTRNMYDDMIKAGTPQSKIRMEIFPGLDHTQGAVPIMIKGLLFLTELENS